MSPTAAESVSWPALNRLMPAFAWLRGYQPGWLLRLLRRHHAGRLPGARRAGVCHASLARLKPEAALATRACLAGLSSGCFAVHGTRPFPATSAISLLIGVAGDLAGGDTTRFAALAAGTALLVAFIAGLAWLVKRASLSISFPRA